MRIQELLRRNKVPFEVLANPGGKSLAKLAKEGQIPGSEVAQISLLRANHGYRYLLAVAPLDRSLDLHDAARALEGCDLALASSEEQCQFCPDCEAGHLMPFGSHYNVRTLLDQRLAEGPTIAFDELDRSAVIRMKTSDFREIEHPFVVPLTREAP